MSRRGQFSRGGSPILGIEWIRRKGLSSEQMVSSNELPATSAIAPGTRMAPVPARMPPARRPLPAPVSSFVGRETQMADVERVLASNRLVTLTGAGGCGKTRLALEVARRRRHAFRDDALFVPLA